MDIDWANMPDSLYLLTGYDHSRTHWWSQRPLGTELWLLMVSLNGFGRFGADKGWICPPKTAVLIKPQAPHDYGPDMDTQIWERIWIHFLPRPEWHEWLAWPKKPGGVMALDLEGSAVWDDVEAAIWRVHRHASASSQHDRAIAMNYLERVFLLCYDAQPNDAPKLDPRISQINQYLGQRLGAEATLERLAELTSLSASRLSHLFRKEMGVPLIQYINSQRLKRARELLEWSTVSIQRIAEELDMEPAYFSAWFKNHAGVSPRGYRNSRQLFVCAPKQNSADLGDAEEIGARIEEE